MDFIYFNKENTSLAVNLKALRAREVVLSRASLAESLEGARRPS